MQLDRPKPTNASAGVQQKLARPKPKNVDAAVQLQNEVQWPKHVTVVVVRPQPTSATEAAQRLSVGAQAKSALNLQMADREWPKPTSADEELAAGP